MIAVNCRHMGLESHGDHEMGARMGASG